MSSSNGNADETTDVTQQPIQSNGEGNLRSDLLRNFGMLSSLKKELKIRGQIGEAGQKDKLTYVSLVHQIKQARLTGYTDQEVINIVISSMVPGLTLRTVLETTPNLTLDRLTQFLEAQYEQKNAHELCNTMTNMLQFPEESVYTFVMRCLEVRQKILLVSEKSCDLSYSPGFINKLFLRTIERGVSHLFVVQEIKSLLRSENVCDEVLLAAIVKASASEKERSMLQAAAQTPKKVVRVHETNSRQEEAKSKQHDDSISKLVSAVDVLTSKLSSLQQDFDIMKQKNVKSRNFLYAKCNVCTLNKVDKCTHCYLCGVEGHLARRSPNRSNSEN